MILDESGGICEIKILFRIKKEADKLGLRAHERSHRGQTGPLDIGWAGLIITCVQEPDFYPGDLHDLIQGTYVCNPLLKKHMCVIRFISIQGLGTKYSTPSYICYF